MDGRRDQSFLSIRTVITAGLAACLLASMQTPQFIELSDAFALSTSIRFQQPWWWINHGAGHCDQGRTLAESARDLRLALSRRDSALHEHRELQRPESLALLVLDHLVVAVGRFVDERGNLLQSRQPGGPQPTLACDQFEPTSTSSN